MPYTVLSSKNIAENKADMTTSVIQLIVQQITDTFLFSSSVMPNSFATPRTIAHQALLSMGFPRQEYWSGLPFPSPEYRHLISNYKFDLWW